MALCDNELGDMFSAHKNETYVTFNSRPFNPLISQAHN